MVVLRRNLSAALFLAGVTLALLAAGWALDRDGAGPGWLPQAFSGDRGQRLPVVVRPGDRDCSDFRTRADAQRFYEAAGRGDRHRLDDDGDGWACEWGP